MTAPPPLPAEVLRRVQEYLADVRESGHPEPTAMTLATASAEGRPSSRTVLLKGVTEHGFVFYTNLESRKGGQLSENPFASLTFFFPAQARQIQVEGPIERVPDEEADAYWASRPRDSQLGGWASKQSREMEGRGELLRRVAEVAARHPIGDVPRPPFWSGFRLRPERLEFWTGKPFRLHERELWVAEDGEWGMRRLFP
ncbi:MAG: pyridoxamine 5'-phosphate oxidase [Gemmatimonadetes bacterium]|nr:pyridoxamine 5'-phosphate oxidase [Gemmatimonadota bacterium]